MTSPPLQKTYTSSSTPLVLEVCRAPVASVKNGVDDQSARTAARSATCGRWNRVCSMLLKIPWRAFEKYHMGPTVTERRIWGVPVSNPSVSSSWSYRAVRPTWWLIFRNAVTAAPRHEGLPPLCCSRPTLASAPAIKRPRSMVRSLENSDRWFASLKSRSGPYTPVKPSVTQGIGIHWIRASPALPRLLSTVTSQPLATTPHTSTRDDAV